MTEVQIQGFALIATLVSLPLVSWGTTDGPSAATVVGALLLAAGLGVLTALRFIDLEENS